MHVEPPPIPPIKSKNDEKLDNFFIKIKLRRDPTSQKSDLCELKMSLFDNGEPEYFLLFFVNFNMTLKVSGPLLDGAKIQYHLMLVHGEALRQFDMFSADVGSTTLGNVKSVILGLGMYFHPVNAM